MHSEESCREALAPEREALPAAHLQHGVAAAFGLPARAGLVRRLQGKRLDAAIRRDRL